MSYVGFIPESFERLAFTAQKQIAEYFAPFHPSFDYASRDNVYNNAIEVCRLRPDEKANCATPDNDNWRLLASPFIVCDANKIVAADQNDLDPYLLMLFHLNVTSPEVSFNRTDRTPFHFALQLAKWGPDVTAERKEIVARSRAARLNSPPSKATKKFWLF